MLTHLMTVRLSLETMSVYKLLKISVYLSISRRYFNRLKFVLNASLATQGQ
jgi:hypothetical protein